MKFHFLKFSFPAILLALALLLTGCGDGIISSEEDIPGHAVGVIAGTASIYYAAHYETLGASVITYDSADMLAAAIGAGYVDCGIADTDAASACQKANRKVKTLDSSLADDGYCIAVALENPQLLENIDAALAAMTESGEVRNLVNTYLGGKTVEDKKSDTVYDHTLIAAVDDTISPYAFHGSDGALDGLDVALAKAIGEKLGVNIEFLSAASSDLMEEVRKGNADFALGALVSTEETSQLVRFSQPYLEVTQVLLVRK